MGWLSKRLFRIAKREVTFVERGFSGTDGRVRARLERVGLSFLEGYHAALEESRPYRLAFRLNAVPSEFRGFAFEGAGMGLAVVGAVFPWRRRLLHDFLNGPGDPHTYLVHVGAGMAMARLPRRLRWAFSDRFHPVLRGLLFDGLGFHEGYFHWPDSVRGHRLPEGLSNDEIRAFDQGLGRSLWFVEGADAERIPDTIAAFPEARRGDLWSGVGLACAYAGGVSGDAVEALREAAGAHRPHLAQGAAFAAKARHRAGNLIEATERACQTLCGLAASDAARVTDEALEALPPGEVLSYQRWRSWIQDKFSQ